MNSVRFLGGSTRKAHGAAASVVMMVCGGSAFAQALLKDIAGSKDPAGIRRYESSTIIGCEFEKFGEHEALPRLMGADEIAAATWALLAQAALRPVPDRVRWRKCWSDDCEEIGPLQSFGRSRRADRSVGREAWATAALPWCEALATVEVSQRAMACGHGCDRNRLTRRDR